uniref:Uncharacterized protein n=1 Tax=Rhizophora mucronata TaxID=61149 RepID=A0A2P2IHI5_RHIMU
MASCVFHNSGRLQSDSHSMGNMYFNEHVLS